MTVVVTWPGREAGPVFDVALDTHSVDLDGVDLARQAVLRTDAGVVVQPSAWDAPRGGHHRSGTLRFPSATPDGAPVVGTGPFELDLRDVAGVPSRTFRWTP